MKYARISAGIVAETGDFATPPVFHESLTWAACPDNVVSGWRYADAVFSPPVVDLDHARAAKRGMIDLAFAAAVARGLVWGDGDAIQIEDAPRQNIAARASRAGFVLAGTAGFTWPPGGMPYRTRNNVWPTFTPAEFVAMAGEVDDLYTAIRVRYAALKEQLAAAQTAEDIAAVAPAAGWPN